MLGLGKFILPSFWFQLWTLIIHGSYSYLFISCTLTVRLYTCQNIVYYNNHIEKTYKTCIIVIYLTDETCDAVWRT